MISSLSMKDGMHIMANDAAAEFNTHFDGKNGKYFDLHKKIMLTNNSISQQRQEINLPKTKVTKRGQLYLYTNGKRESISDNNSYKSSLIKKSYSKKWMDDITLLDAGLEPSQFFEENAVASSRLAMSDSSPIKKTLAANKLGRQTDHFVREIKSRQTGKDRCMSRASYLEFLPDDYDTKAELAETLKTLTSPRKQRNDHSSVSFNNEDVIEECISSDEEKIVFSSNETTKPNSRLSTQPVLSAKSLINRLSCKIIQDEEKSTPMLSSSLLPQTTTTIDTSDSSLSIKYKEHFNPDEATTPTNTVLQSDQPSIKIPFGEPSNASKASIVEPKRPILARRVENQQRTTSRRNSNLFDDNDNTSNVTYVDELKLLNKSSSTRHDNKLSNRADMKSPALKQGLVLVKPPHRPSSPPRVSNASPDLIQQVMIGSNLNNQLRLNELPNMNNQAYKHQLSPRSPHQPDNKHHQLFYNLNNTNSVDPSIIAALNSQNRDFYGSNEDVENDIKIVEDDGIEDKEEFLGSLEELGIGGGDTSSILISLTQIDDEKTGASVRIRKFFDRRCLQIKQMNIGSKPPITASSLGVEMRRVYSANINNRRRVSKSSKNSEPNSKEKNKDKISELSDRSSIYSNKPKSASDAVRKSTTITTRIKSAPAKQLRNTPTYQFVNETVQAMIEIDSSKNEEVGKEEQRIEPSNSVTNDEIENEKEQQQQHQLEQEQEENIRSDVKIVEAEQEHESIEEVIDEELLIDASSDKEEETEKGNGGERVDVEEKKQIENDLEKRENEIDSQKDTKPISMINDEETTPILVEETFEPKVKSRESSPREPQTVSISTEINPTQNITQPIEIAPIKEELINNRKIVTPENPITEKVIIITPPTEEDPIRVITPPNQPESKEQVEIPSIKPIEQLIETPIKSIERIPTPVKQIKEPIIEKIVTPVKEETKKVKTPPKPIAERTKTPEKTPIDDKKSEKPIQTTIEAQKRPEGRIIEKKNKPLIKPTAIKDKEKPPTPKSTSTVSSSKSSVNKPDQSIDNQTEHVCEHHVDIIDDKNLPKIEPEEKSIADTPSQSQQLKSEIIEDKVAVAPIAKSSKKVEFSKNVEEKIIEAEPATTAEEITKTKEGQEETKAVEKEEKERVKEEGGEIPLVEETKLQAAEAEPIPKVETKPEKPESSRRQTSEKKPTMDAVASSEHSAPSTTPRNRRIVLKKDGVKSSFSRNRSPTKTSAAAKTPATATSTSTASATATVAKDSPSSSQPELDPKSNIPNLNINLLLGIKEPDEDLDLKNKKVPPPIIKKDTSAKYSHFKIPWYSEEPILNPLAYHAKFDVPESLLPELRNLDPKNVSIDELIYERRVLEDRILDLRKTKLEDGKNEVIGKKISSKASSKKPPSKKGSMKKVEQRRMKDLQSKDRVIYEERKRLHDETVRIQLERENMRKLFSERFADKQKEIEDLESQMETNTQEFERQRKHLEEQLKYLEETEDEIHDALVRSRAELRDQMLRAQARARIELKQAQEERREDKMFEMDVRRKELVWLLDIHVEEDELNRVRAQLVELDVQRERWLRDHEDRVVDEERELDEREENEEDRLAQVEQEEEENALGELRRQQFVFVQERKILIENFDEIKMKINDRIESIKEEKKLIESERRKFEDDVQTNVEKQREKLEEIIEAENQAREMIQNELEKYKYELMSRREKNLEMRSNYSFLEHCQSINKPYVFSYGIYWPLELLAGAPNDPKKKPIKKK